ncbi:zingipain-2 [Rosa chinensis]|nr:zingipain-2 [Rosa chinensis]
MDQKMFLIVTLFFLPLFAEATPRMPPTKPSSINTTTTLSSNSSFNFRYKSLNLNDLPTEIDWVKERLVTPVKDQLGCGSCWAFAAVAAVEGIAQRATGELRVLSEQQLLDCSRDFGTNGCRGSGHRLKAFNYIKEHGVAYSDKYPYKGTDTQACDNTTVSYPAATITGYERVPNNEMDLIRAVANQPVTASVFTCDEFNYYTGGYIFEDREGKCNFDIDKANHAITIVGYGTENGVDYWKIKNSWGEDWGDKGYMKMRRNVATKPEGICGIASAPIYPTDDIAPSRSNPEGPSKIVGGPGQTPEG